MDDWRSGKPYRPNVGICLINKDGKIWMGKGRSAGPEFVTPGSEWQMPQGGIEITEDAVEAARRELWEETAARSIEFLAVSEDWWTYDFPVNYSPTGHKLDAYRGQKQRWVAFRFTGDDAEFSIAADHTDEPAEFLDWRWMSLGDALDMTVPYKIEQYHRVFRYFSEFLGKSVN